MWSYVHYWWNKPQQASYAIILVSGQKPLRVNLRQAQQIRVQGQLGESVLEVSAGKIRFLQSACQNKHCVHAGWLTQGGDFVACLPNQVSIAIYGKEMIKLDAIAY